MEQKTQICYKCNTEKPLSIEFFSANPKMKCGFIGICKRCSNLINRERDRKRAMLPHRVLARKNYIKSHPEVRKGILNRWYKNNPLKKKASQMVNNAVRDNRLFKKPCEVCKEIKVEAHHEDYSKPLEVIWLCNKHHRIADKKRRVVDEFLNNL